MTTNTLDQAWLQRLAEQFPSPDAAVGEMARLAAELTLPKGTIHVISDVHGEDGKLRHIINNASGTLRPRIEQLFAARLSAQQLQEFVTLIFYPRETLECLEPALTDPAARHDFCLRMVRQLIEVIRWLARGRSWARVQAALPSAYRDYLQDALGQVDGALEAGVQTLIDQGRAFAFIRLTVRIVRDLAIDELVLAGDCWDRGPRGDRVVEYLRRLPNVAFTWGNHDAAWLGACLGHEALIAQVLRMSLRYRRLSQLEEGYGINLQPLEVLARTVYATDPAVCFLPRGTGLRETVHMARMQKAAALMQFKLEGSMIERHPEWQLDHRRLLHRMDRAAGTITIDGTTCTLKDTYFPTIDAAHPYELSPEERTCLTRIKQSFMRSQILWEHMRFLVGRGSMWLKRDDHLIFHGCVPVDERGDFLPLAIDDRVYRGRALFDALERKVVQSLERPGPDLDWLWYLWCGPRSPLFGKDKIATFEMDLVHDKAMHVETKNAYFQLLHEAAFCERILTEFGADAGDAALIVNGHVPVKIDQGEKPLKRSGKAITIDGAFSAVYGDHGYTLVLEPERTFLAKHHHFESVEAAVHDGVDIIPEITEVQRWDSPRRVSETEKGEEIRAHMDLLQQLIDAYRSNQLRQRTGNRK